MNSMTEIEENMCKLFLNQTLNADNQFSILYVFMCKFILNIRVTEYYFVNKRIANEVHFLYLVTLKTKNHYLKLVSGKCRIINSK